jgi:hypothetical protein
VPILDLPQLHLAEAGIYLTAVMFHPRQPERHAAFVQAAKNSALRRTISKHRPSRVPDELHADILAAVVGPRLEDRDLRDARALLLPSGEPRDLAAGLLLVYVLACAEAGEPCTVAAAMDVLTTGAGARAGPLPGRSRSNIMSCWAEFAPVAHLSAVRLFLPELWQNAASSANGSRLALFLAYAEALRILGESYRRSRAARPLLNPAEEWRLPDWVVLPPIGPLRLPAPPAIRGALTSSPDSARRVHGLIN